MRERLVRTAAVLMALLGAMLIGSGANVVAADDPSNGPRADLSTFPEPLPDGCPEGWAALHGTRFGVAGSAGSSSSWQGDLAELELGAGDTITMTWDGFDAGCLDAAEQPGVRITLAAYLSATETFDQNVDQQLVDWAACGPKAQDCVRGADGYRLELAVPAPTIGCQFQLDAILGAPLPVVGPGGSFYSPSLRGNQGPALLISARSLTVPNCVPVPPTTAPVSTAATVTAAPATTAAPVTLVSTAESVLAAGAQQAQALPATGTGTGRTAGVGMALVASGAALLALSMRRGARRLEPAAEQ